MSTATTQLHEVDQIIIPDLNIIPSTDLKLTDEHNLTVAADESVYRSDSPFPKLICEFTDYGYMRNIYLARLIINPFIYNPVSKQLTVITHAIISAQFSMDNPEHYAVPNHSSINFTKLATEMAVNSESINERSTPTEGSYLFVYRGSNILPILNNLIEWKKKIGYFVHSIDIDEVGTQNSEVKAYIQNLYDNDENPPEYICLVGDAIGDYSIPSYYEHYGYHTQCGDHEYSLLSGNDSFPDALVE